MRNWVRLCIARLFPWLFTWKTKPIIKNRKADPNRFVPRVGALGELVLPNGLAAAAGAFGDAAITRAVNDTPPIHHASAENRYSSSSGNDESISSLVALLMARSNTPPVVPARGGDGASALPASNQTSTPPTADPNNLPFQDPLPNPFDDAGSRRGNRPAQQSPNANEGRGGGDGGGGAGGAGGGSHGSDGSDAGAPGKNPAVQAAAADLKSLFNMVNSMVGTGSGSAPTQSFTLSSFSSTTNSPTGTGSTSSSNTLAAPTSTSRAATTVALTSTTIANGQPTTLTGTITAAGGTAAISGSISFYDNGNLLGTRVVANGTATITTPALQSGKHSFVGVYLGDDHYQATISPSLDATIAAPPVPTLHEVNVSYSPSIQDVTGSLSTLPGSYHVLPTGDGPVAVGLGNFAGGSTIDLVALNRDGTLTVALNNDNGVWRDVSTFDTGLTQGNGLVVGRFFGTASDDVAVVGPDSIVLLKNNGLGQFSVAQTINAPSAGAFSPSDGGTVQPAVARLDNSGRDALVVPLPGTNEVRVYAIGADGTVGTPQTYASGGVEPVAVVVGDFVGDALPDIAVGHRGGGGTVTFLQGKAGGTFQLQPTLTVTGLGLIKSMAAGNFGGSGVQLAVSSSNGVTILSNNHDPAAQTNPIANGSFASGLSGWEVTSGTVTSDRGFTQFQESGTSLTSTLEKTFIVPQGATTLSFDVTSLGLEATTSGVPDAFEVSLLDGQSNSLVGSFSSDATSFINFQPGGSMSKASGVTFDGRRVTVDISSLTPGSAATLVFDLIGNPPGQASTATIANVQVSAQTVDENFAATPLAGTFGQVAGITVGDVNGDGNADLIVADPQQDTLHVYTGDGAGSFTSTIISVANFGLGASAIAAGRLLPGSNNDQLAVALTGSDLVLNPLVFDVTAPQVTLVTPGNGSATNLDVGAIRLQFSEAVQDNGPTGAHSITNPASYTLLNTTTGQTVAIASVTYDSLTFAATLNLGAPLADGVYRLAVNGTDVTSRAIEDAADNRLGDGTDAVFMFTVERVAPATVSFSPASLWPPNHQMVSVHANITVGTLGLPSTAKLLSIASNEPMPGPGNNHVPDFDGATFGTDDRDFRLRAERNGDGSTRIYSISYFVRDAAGNGSVVVGYVVVPHDQGSVTVLPSTTTPGLGSLQTSSITQINNLSYTIGNTAIGSVSQAGTVNVYAFSATAGQQLFFDAQAGSPTALHWALSNATGTVVFSGNLADRGPIILPSGGTYYLTVDGRDTQTGSYQFKVWNVPATVTSALTINAPVSGAISVPGQQAKYTFGGTAGDRFFFKVQNPASGALHFTVLGPTGSTLLAVSNADQGNSFALPTTGTYTVLVQSASTPDATGNYRFEVISVPADVPQAISQNDSAVSGTLSVPGQTQSYTFAANLGQTLQFHLGSNPSGNVVFTLLDPNGNTVFRDQTADQTVASAPANGNYTLIAHGVADATGSYQVQVVDQSALPTEGIDPAINLDTPVNGQLTTFGQVDTYTFTAAAGQKLFFEGITGVARYRWQLVTPTGQSVFNQTFGSVGPYIASVAGQYTLTITASPNIGLYSFEVWNVPDPVPVPITLGQVVTVQLNHPFDQPTYTLNVNAGQWVYFDLPNGRNGSNWKLVDPNGHQIFFTSTYPQGAWQMLLTGTYTLSVIPSFSSFSPYTPTSFTFDAVSVTPSSPVAVTLDQAVSAAITTPGAVDLFTFNGVAGQQVYLQTISGGQFAFQWQLTSPSGQQIFSDNFISRTSPLTLSETGTYVISIEGQAAWTGPFSFSVLNVTPPTVVPISVGDHVAGQLDNPVKQVLYTFYGTPGRQILFSPDHSSSSRVTRKLIAPNGTVLFDDYFGNVSTPVTITSTGQYQLLIGFDTFYTTTFPVTYDFDLLDYVIPSVPISFNTVVSGSITQLNEVDYYSFSANAGDAFYLNIIQNTTNTSFQRKGFSILAPDGSLVVAPTFSTSTPFVAPLTGTYLVKIDTLPGNAAGGISNYQFNVQTAIPLSVDDPPVSGPLNVGQAYLYTFSGSAGQRVFLNIPNQTAAGYSIIAPNRATVLAPNSASPDVLTLPTTGTYFLVVRNFQSFNSTFGFELVNVAPTTTQAIPLDQVLNDSLQSYGQRKNYTFSGTAGQQLVFDFKGNSNQVPFTLTGPTGSTLFSQTTSNQVVTLSASGTYTLTAAGYFTGNSNQLPRGAKGPFSFQVQEVTVGADATTGNATGTDFWVALPHALSGGWDLFTGLHEAPHTWELDITSSVDTSGAVFVAALGYKVAFTVAAGQVTTIQLPPNVPVDWSEGGLLPGRGVHIEALGEVQVYTAMVLRQSGGTVASSVLPTNALGLDYRVMTWAGGSPFDGNEFAITGTADGTNVTITQSIDFGGHAAGQPYTITLNAGDVYELTSGGANAPEFIGTHIQSDHPVTVVSGHTAATVPVNLGNIVEGMLQELPSIDKWGTHFLTVPFATRQGGDVFRYLASADNTQITVNGTLVATLNAGQYFEQTVTTVSEVTSNKPILIAQFSHSQAFDSVTAGNGMMLVPAIGSAAFAATSFAVVQPTKAVGFDNYVNVIVPQSDVGSLTLDGVAVAASAFTAIGTSGYWSARLSVTPGYHTLAAPTAFQAFAYGFATNDFYGYALGGSAPQSQTIGSIALSPHFATNLVQTTDSVQATVLDTTGNPVSGATVTFQVSGANTATGSGTTDATGHVFFSYTGAAAGTDTITATVATFTATSSVHWVSQAPTITLTAPPDGTALMTGSGLVLSGVARPGSPFAPIARVTVNGQAVDSSDAAGGFFHRITLGQGTNTFTVVATDVLGQTAIATLTLIGTPATAPDLATMQDVTAMGAVRYAATTFNRHTQTLHAEAQLAATGSTPLQGPVYAVYAPFTPPAVSLASADGQTQSGQAYLQFTGQLQPGESTPARAISFTDAVHTRFDFQVTLLADGNHPPEFSSVPPTLAAAGVAYRYQATVADPDGNVLSYRLTSAPSGMTVDPMTSLVSWTPAASQIGDVQVTLVADDGFGGTATQTFTIRVTPQLTAPPVFRSVPPTQAAVGATYTYAPDVFSPTGSALSFTLSTTAAGITFNAATGAVTLPNAVSGTFAVSITATDAAGNHSTQAYVLSVGAATGSAVSIRSTPQDAAIVGTPYIYAVDAVDSNHAPLTYSLPNAPPGMGISSTGVITWTPEANQTGPFTVVVNVTDSLGASAVQVYTLLAQNDLPPAITSQPVTIATQDVAYHYQVTATDPEGQTLHFSLVNPLAGMTIGDTSGEITWTPTVAQLGLRSVTVAVTDPGGHTAFQSFHVDVRVPSIAPTFTSTAPASVVANTAYRYLLTAADATDGFTFSKVDGPAGMSVNPTTGLVYWKPGTNDIGDHSIVLRVTNDRGLTFDQAFTLTVTADATPPQVAFSFPGLLIDQAGQPFAELGDVVTVVPMASDNVRVASLTLTVNGQAVSLTNGSYSFTASTSGIVTIVATAVDASGNTTTATSRLRIADPNDVTAPHISLTSPTSNATVSYLTDITGTIADPDLAYYRVEYSLVNANEWHLITQSNTPVVNGTLATFDPTLLPNDTYTIRIVAVDATGNQTERDIEVNVIGNAKLGNFHLEFTDLSIPLTGIPITIKRVYDTLNASKLGDFGYGWQLSLLDPQIHVTVPSTEVAGLPLFPYREGTKVYLTDPDGNRVGFTFTPTEQDFIETPLGLQKPTFGPIYHAAFTADPGVYDKLATPDIALTKDPDGTFRLYGFGVAYNPDTFQLTTTDNLTYTYNKSSGLQSIADLNGNTLTVTPNGIVSSTGKSIQFVRNANGQIEQIIDPAGKTLTYEYDASGNLVRTSDRMQTQMTYEYGAGGAPSHFMTAIRDAEGRLVLSGTYDASGRNISATDGSGNATTRGFDLDTLTETVKDPLGNPTTYVYDVDGNVLKMVDPLGGVTTKTYDANHNVLTETDPLGHTTAYTYDEHGNELSETDPLGKTTFFTYNSANFLLTSTDPLGHTVTNDYDASGNLLSTTDPAGNSTRYVYDEFGDRLFRMDALGNVTQYQYDAFGDLVRFVDALGHEMTFVYDDLGNRVQQVIPVTTSTGVRDLVRKTVVNANGQPTSTVDPDSNVTRYEYNAQGKLSAEVDARGHRIEYEYDVAGRLVTTRYHDGTVETQEYDAAGRTVASTDRLGRKTQYVYDALGQLIKTIAPDGTFTRSEYDAAGRLTATIDELGKRTEYGYDAAGRQALVRDALGNESRKAYDDAGNVVSETDALGRVTQYVYDSRRQLVETTYADGTHSTIDYNQLGEVVTETDTCGCPVNPEAQTTHYIYDSVGRNVGQQDALGYWTYFTYDEMGNVVAKQDANGNTTRYEYDGSGRQTAEILPLGQRATSFYDGVGNLVKTTDFNGNATTYSYDDDDRLSTQTYADGSSIAFTYDVAGQLLSEKNERGYSTTYEYDLRGRVTSVTDALGHTTKTTYDDAGRAIRVTDALGKVTESGYDDVGRVIRRTDALGGVTEFAYDAVGNLLLEKDANGHETAYTYDLRNRQLTVADPLGGVTQNVYDELGRLTSVTDPLGHTTSFEYDDAGQRTATILPLGQRSTTAYDPVGNVISETDFNGKTTTYDFDENGRNTAIHSADGTSLALTYDGNGQIISRTDALGHTTTIDYDVRGRQIAYTDPLGHTTTTGYDAAGNVTSITDALGNVTHYGYDAVNQYVKATDPLGAITRNAYDAVGNRVSMTDANGNVTSFEYDALHRQVSETDPLGAKRTYGYDSVGNLVRLTDRDGRVSVFGYDDANHRTSETWLDENGDPTRTFTYQYDLAGQLISASDPDSSYTLSYDNNQRISTVSNAGTPRVPNVTLDMSYDGNGNQTNLAAHVNSALDCTTARVYDALGRLTQITQVGPAAATKRVDLSYDAAGRLESVSRYANLAGSQPSVQSTYEFDPADRLVQLKHTAGMTTVASYSLTYDADNNITHETSSAGSSDYSYDLTKQLVSATHDDQANESNTYDLVGNRTNGNQIGTGNRLLSDASYTYEYDAEGNRTSRTDRVSGEKTTYEWDYRNRLTHVAVESAQGVIERQEWYTYDAFDRRIAVTTDANGSGRATAQTTHYVYDGDNIVLTLDDHGAVTHRYLYGAETDSILADEHVSQSGQPGQILWMLPNHQGSIQDVVSSSGAVLNHIEYNSFGVIVSQTNPSLGTIFTFTGREWDVTAGLYYYRARYYDAGSQQFISEDPLGLGAEDPNLARYVDNNPVNALDPTGTLELLPQLLVPSPLAPPDGAPMRPTPAPRFPATKPGPKPVSPPARPPVVPMPKPDAPVGPTPTKPPPRPTTSPGPARPRPDVGGVATEYGLVLQAIVEQIVPSGTLLGKAAKRAFEIEFPGWEWDFIFTLKAIQELEEALRKDPCDREGVLRGQVKYEHSLAIIHGVPARRGFTFFSLVHRALANLPLRTKGSNPSGAARALIKLIGNPGDEVGHVIGRQFGGRAGVTSGNIFPEAIVANRRQEGFENSLPVGSQRVCLLVELTYDSSPVAAKPYRPTWISMTAWVDRKIRPPRTIQNI